MKSFIRKIIFWLCFGMAFIDSQEIEIKNSIIGYTTLGDTVSFDKPYVWSLIKGDKWFTSLFIDAPWARGDVYVKELMYKPYSDKFTIAVGRQAIPFGSNVPYLDFTRGDKFTYQTSEDVGLLYFGDGVSVYGGVGKWFLETYYGSDIENGLREYSAGRVSYEFGDHFVGLSADDQNRQALDVSGYTKYVDYVTEFTEDYQWGRAIVKTGKYGLSLLVGYENFEWGSKPLYGVAWNYGKPNRFISTELSGEGDLRVKLYFGLEPIKIGGKSE